MQLLVYVMVQNRPDIEEDYGILHLINKIIQLLME
jgi:hypothetical protein